LEGFTCLKTFLCRLLEKKITVDNGKLVVPNNPIIPFIEGDGTGPDIWKASVRVLDAAVEKAYKGEKKNRLVRSIRR